MAIKLPTTLQLLADEVRFNLQQLEPSHYESIMNTLMQEYPGMLTKFVHMYDKEYFFYIRYEGELVTFWLLRNETIDLKRGSLPYSEMVESLFKDMGSKAANIMHAGAGLAGEGGEVLDAAKKSWVYGKDVDVENILEELGDVRFYMQAMMNIFGWDMNDIECANRNKLAKRYPTGVYNNQHAQERLDKIA